MADKENYQGEILAALGIKGILLQLAEEAAELAQAALKYHRAMDGTNPTPVTVEDARKAFIEEYADVLSCGNIILTTKDHIDICDTSNRKQKRWAKRIREREYRE